jgi:hypothetical protein
MKEFKRKNLYLTKQFNISIKKIVTTKTNMCQRVHLLLRRKSKRSGRLLPISTKKHFMGKY